MKWLNELLESPTVGALCVGVAVLIVCDRIGIGGWESHAVPILAGVGYLVLINAIRKSN
jgi:hypothetical protein